MKKYVNTNYYLFASFCAVSLLFSSGRLNRCRMQSSPWDHSLKPGYIYVVISPAPQSNSPYLHVQPAMALKIPVHTLYSTVHNVSYLAGINSCNKPSQIISNDRTFVNTYSRIVSLSYIQYMYLYKLCKEYTPPHLLFVIKQYFRLFFHLQYRSKKRYFPLASRQLNY